MALSIPSAEEIAARAVELELISAGDPVTPAVRRKVAALLSAEVTEAAARPAGAPELISRTNYDVPGGKLRVDVVFIPTPKPKDSSHG